jgi:hypothetical protein
LVGDFLVRQPVSFVLVEQELVGGGEIEANRSLRVSTICESGSRSGRRWPPVPSAKIVFISPTSVDNSNEPLYWASWRKCVSSTDEPRSSRSTVLVPRTFDRYSSDISGHILPAIGRHRLDKLRPAHLAALYNAKAAEGLSPSSLRHIHAVIRRAPERGGPLAGPRHQPGRWSMLRRPARMRSSHCRLLRPGG